MCHSVRVLAAMIVLLCSSGAVAADADEEHIRAIVRQMLAEKDAQIEQLEERVHLLERQLAQQEPQAAPAPPQQAPVAVAPVPAPAAAPAAKTEKDSHVTLV